MLYEQIRLFLFCLCGTSKPGKNIKIQNPGRLGAPPSDTHAYIYKMYLRDMP